MGYRRRKCAVRIVQVLDHVRKADHIGLAVEPVEECLGIPYLHVGLAGCIPDVEREIDSYGSLCPQYPCLLQENRIRAAEIDDAADRFGGSVLHQICRKLRKMRPVVDAITILNIDLPMNLRILALIISP